MRSVRVSITEQKPIIELLSARGEPAEGHSKEEPERLSLGHWSMHAVASDSLWPCGLPGFLSMRFLRQEHQCGLAFPSPTNNIWTLKNWSYMHTSLPVTTAYQPSGLPPAESRRAPSPSCSSLGKTWCSALPSASSILGHFCCYQGTHVSTWVTGVVVIPGEESENSQAYSSYLLELLIVCHCLGCQQQEEKEETIAEKHLETTGGQGWMGPIRGHKDAVCSIWGVTSLYTVYKDTRLALFFHSY